MALESIRRAVYAGSWYEADPRQLSLTLNHYLDRALPSVDTGSASLLKVSNPPLNKPILALVVPHAGYQFSGQAAAYAYKLAQEQTVNRIFLLGPSHQVAFHGGALPEQTIFQTPLGNLEVDKEIKEVLKAYPIFAELPAIHRIEHSLEMQLPFIRQVFGQVKIVPIVVGTLSDESDIRLMSGILQGFVGKGDLVIVSSDFTHFGPRYDYRPFRQNIRENIARLDSEAFQLLSVKDLDQFLAFQRKTDATICGFYPLSVLVALLPDAARGTLLKYYTSQDTTGEDAENSVSYMAIAFSGGAWAEHNNQIDKTFALCQSDKDALLQIARTTIESYVRTKKTPEARDHGIAFSETLCRRLGVFVTLNRRAAGSDNLHPGHDRPDKRELRGCIGYIWPLKPLYQAVIDNAVSACSCDYRFHAVTPDELKDIAIEISVLTPPRRISSYKEIVLGRDGIVLYKNKHQSVFLPFVATMFGWDLEQTLAQLAKKAGLEEDDWQDGCKFDTFQAEVFQEKEG